MQDYLMRIGGSAFLIIFPLYSICIIGLSWIYVYNDESKYKGLPEVNDFSAYELAFLRGGVRILISIKLFDMWRRGIINMYRKRNAIAFTRKEECDQELTGMDKIIWDNLKKPQSYKSLVKNKSLEFSNHFSIQIARLQRLGLIADEDLLTKYKNVFFIGAILILIPGIIKLLMGLQHHRPVLFLGIEILLLVYLLFLILKKIKPNKTYLGKKLLIKARTRFEWLKLKGNITQEEELYGVAVFGISQFKKVYPDLSGSFPSSFDTGGWIWFGGCTGCSGGCGGGIDDGGAGCSSGCSNGCSGCGGCGGD